MNPDVVAHGAAQQSVDVDQAFGYDRAAVLGGNHQEIGFDLVCGTADRSADIPRAVMWLHLHSIAPGPLHRFVKHQISRAFATP